MMWEKLRGKHDARTLIEAYNHTFYANHFFLELKVLTQRCLFVFWVQLSHLIGFFYRTIRMVESGIKPVYVFDGKPPTLKSGEVRESSFSLEEERKKYAALFS